MSEKGFEHTQDCCSVYNSSQSCQLPGKIFTTLLLQERNHTVAATAPALLPAVQVKTTQKFIQF
jgi:hypothetical protein